MKRLLVCSAGFVFAVALLVLLVPGCASPNPAAAPVFPTFTTNVVQTNVTVLVTNLTVVQTPPTPAQTNIVWMTNVTVLQTNLTLVQTNVITNLPPPNTNAAFLPNKTGTAIVGDLVQVVPFVPAPYGTLLTAVLAAATAGMGLLAKIKINQKKTADAATAQLAASVVAQGPAVAQAVSAHAAGNATSGPAVVAAITRHTALKQGVTA